MMKPQSEHGSQENGGAWLPSPLPAWRAAGDHYPRTPETRYLECSRQLNYGMQIFRGVDFLVFREPRTRSFGLSARGKHCWEREPEDQPLEEVHSNCTLDLR